MVRTPDCLSGYRSSILRVSAKYKGGRHIKMGIGGGESQVGLGQGWTRLLLRVEIDY